MPNKNAVSLGSLVSSVSAGYSPICEARPAEEGEIGVLKLSAVSEGRFFPAENKVPVAANPTEFRRPVRAGSILMSRSNTIEFVGSCAYVGEHHANLFLPDLLWEIRVNDESNCNPKWLALRLNAPDMRRELQSRAAGTSGSMRKLSITSLRSIQLHLPSREMQDEAVAVFDVCDSILDISTRQIKGKRRLKKALMQQLLTGTRRLQGFSGPWAPNKLGELFSERCETNRDDLPLLSISANRGLILRDEVQRKDTSNSDKSRYKRIGPGDIGYNTMRMWQGVSALSNLEGIVSPAYTVCTPTEKVDGEYAAHFFKLSSIVNLFYRYSQGLVDDTRNLKFHHFAQIPVRIPNVDEQQAIAEVLNTADRELELLERQLELYKKQKRGLMQKLLTGQIRVKEATGA